MKKLFNNSTKGNETQNQSSKSKRKFLKTFSFTSLALLMGIAGTMAFAPLGASPSVANANEIETTTTETGGLIVPKKDDPVIYTTESGLEIKWGNATTILGGGNESTSTVLDSGNLSGFPYFTTGSYIWVIIGKSTSGSYVDKDFGGDIAYEKVSYWKTNYSSSPTYTYFFNNIYESKTPAGAVINNTDANDLVARKLQVMLLASSLSSLVSNAEIPSGCVLCFANAKVAMSKFGSSGAYNGSTLHNLVAGYYTNSSLGISSIKSLIQPVTLKQSHRNSESTITNQYMYPLGGNNFKWETYITKAQAKLPDSASWWTRGGHGNYSDRAGAYVDGTSWSSTYDWVGNSYGVRPAFVLKIT